MGITQRTPVRQVRRFASTVSRHGPLGGIRGETAAARKRFRRHALLGPIVNRADRGVRRLQAALDRGFDRRYGTDTAGVVALDELDLAEDEDGGYHWYEAVSRKRFSLMMDALDLSDDDKRAIVFIDLGSGKGRPVLMAAEHGFARAIGVELSESLVRDAIENTERFRAVTGTTCDISHVCSDATAYELPDAPLFVYLYSPFSGAVLDQVVDNIRASYASNPRRMLLAFYGSNPRSVATFDSLGFERTDMKIARDLTQFGNHDTIVYRSPTTTT